MRRAVKFILIVVTLLVVGSWLSLYAYGRFADSAMGEPSHSIAPGGATTMIDAAVAPLVAAHADRSGLVLVSDNADAFAIRALSARHAGRTLDVQYYLWHDDLTGRLLAGELLAAADRGVRVRVLLDDINAHGSDDAMRAMVKHPNIDIRLFNPSRNRGGTIGRAVEMLFRGLSLNRRMHNKAWIVDGQLAVVGGRNIGDEYFDAAHATNFLDADVLVLGRAVGEAAGIFDAFWNSRAVLPIDALRERTPLTLEGLRESSRALRASADAEPYLSHVARSATVGAYLDGSKRPHWTSSARIVSDPPEKALGQGDESNWLIEDILAVGRTATQNLSIISPYFVPGADGTQQLIDAAQQGRQVTVLTNSLASNDVAAVHSGYSRYREALLRGGVRLYELMPFGDTETSLFGSSGASLHTKAFIVDGQRGFVGSFNFDPRSVRLNTEMGLLFDNADVAKEVMALFTLHTGPDHSYRVQLTDDRLVWEDRRSKPPKQLDVDPETSWWQRASVRVLGWLPIENQL